MSALRSRARALRDAAGLRLGRVRDDFVPPDEEPDRACAEPAPRTPPGVALLAPVDDAQPLGAALGLAIATPSARSGRRRLRLDRRIRRPAVVASARDARGAQARHRVRRTRARRADARAARARATGGGAAGCGVGKRAAPRRRPATLRRCSPSEARAPRSSRTLLAEQDLVVVATPSGTDPALRRLALSGLAAGASRACACDVPPAQLGRAAAASGLGCCPRRAGRSPTRSRRCRDAPAPCSPGRLGGRWRVGSSHDPAARRRAWRCSWARWCSARSRAAWACRATSSAPPTSRRSPARARCTTRTGGCSSPRVLGAAREPRRISSAPPTSSSGAAPRVATARRNGARDVASASPTSDTFAPVRIRVDVRDAIDVPARREPVAAGARAEAELAPPSDIAFATGPGEYRGPLAMRQGKPMRPDVAAAFDRMAAAARTRRHLAHRRQRLSLERRAGRAVRAPPGPEMGRAARQVAASARNRARPRPGRRLRLAGRERQALSLRPALFVGAVALRIHAERRQRLGGLRRRRRR